ncbi:MAG: alpha/beta fold hydrolase [Thiotrichaceae bacterium]|nr:alpha/beta fold hydrolase [Thiotrichaceae bacterium]
MLNYRQLGETNNKPPIIFLHGLLGELQNWNTQAKRLAMSYHVINIDLRNHGASPHLVGMSYALMANDLLKLLDALALDKVTLVGHSMGGKVAMYFALHYPQRLDQLVIVDIAPTHYPLWHSKIFTALLSLSLKHIHSRQQADELLAQSISNAFERAFLLKNLSRNADGYYWKSNLQEIASQYLNIAAFPQLALRYHQAAWFIKGADSNYITEENQSFIDHYFPQANVQVIDGAGHLPHVQQADSFHQLLLHILSKK